MSRRKSNDEDTSGAHSQTGSSSVGRLRLGGSEGFRVGGRTPATFGMSPDPVPRMMRQQSVAGPREGVDYSRYQHIDSSLDHSVNTYDFSEMEGYLDQDFVGPQSKRGDDPRLGRLFPSSSDPRDSGRRKPYNKGSRKQAGKMEAFRRRTHEMEKEVHLNQYLSRLERSRDVVTYPPAPERPFNFVNKSSENEGRPYLNKNGDVLDPATGVVLPDEEVFNIQSCKRTGNEEEDRNTREAVNRIGKCVYAKTRALRYAYPNGAGKFGTYLADCYHALYLIRMMHPLEHFTSLDDVWTPVFEEILGEQSIFNISCLTNCFAKAYGEDLLTGVRVRMWQDSAKNKECDDQITVGILATLGATVVDMGSRTREVRPDQIVNSLDLEAFITETYPDYISGDKDENGYTVYKRESNNTPATCNVNILGCGYDYWGDEYKEFCPHALTLLSMNSPLLPEPQDKVKEAIEEIVEEHADPADNLQQIDMSSKPYLYYLRLQPMMKEGPDGNPMNEIVTDKEGNVLWFGPHGTSTEATGAGSNTLQWRNDDPETVHRKWFLAGNVSSNARTGKTKPSKQFDWNVLNDHLEAYKFFDIISDGMQDMSNSSWLKVVNEELKRRRA
jgi:hypothetical protein